MRNASLKCFRNRRSLGFPITTLVRTIRFKRPSSDLPCLSIIVDIDNRFVCGEKTSIPYGNNLCIRVFSVFLFCSFAMAIWSASLSRKLVNPKLSVKVRLGIVGTLYSRSSKSSVQHILTYLPSYCKNNLCGEWVVYAETVTFCGSQLSRTSNLQIEGIASQ